MTLVELVIVLAIMGTVAVTSLPFLQQWKEGIDLRNAATDVADLMLQARMRAIVERRDYTVNVDYAAESCTVQPALRPARIAASVDLYADDTDPECLSLSSRNVVFRPNGTADAVGFEAVFFKSKADGVTVRYRVKVLGATGKISLERWTGGAWSGAF
jgi:Tfp pilus assembly protein FimT